MTDHEKAVKKVPLSQEGVLKVISASKGSDFIR